MKKKNTTITYDELMSELDQYRCVHTDKIIINKQQKEFIKKCRIADKKVPYRTMTALWAKVWQPLSQTAIRTRCDMVLKELNDIPK